MRFIDRLRLELAIPFAAGGFLLIAICASLSCSPSDPTASRRAFGPVSTITRDKYRYGDCVFSAEPHTGKVVFAVVKRPKASGMVFVKTEAGRSIDLHEVSEQVIRDAFPDVANRRLGGEVVFNAEGSNFKFWFAEGHFATLTLSERDSVPGEQLLLGSESRAVSIPCTVDELMKVLGKPDEVQLPN